MYKTVFRIFGEAADGKSEITNGQFQEFAHKRGITDPHGPDRVAVSRIHLRSNLEHARAGTAWINFYDRRFMHPTALREERERINNELSEGPGKKGRARKGSVTGMEHDTTMSIKEFLCGMIRCAHAKYDDSSLYVRWLRFIENNLPQKEELSKFTRNLQLLLIDVSILTDCL